MRVCPQIHRHTCRGQTTKGVTAQELITLFYDTGSLIGLELTSYCQLARQDRQGFTRFCLPSTDLPNASHRDAWPFHLGPRCRTRVPSTTPTEPSLRHLPERHFHSCLERELEPDDSGEERGQTVARGRATPELGQLCYEQHFVA